jgi:polyisoprenoid-binding protein YceI
VQRGQVEVRARSPGQDTITRFSKLAGTIDFDPDDVKSARAELTLDMRQFDAGDRLKNWKLKTDLEPDSYPTATFILARFQDIHEVTAGQFTATAVGQLKHRDATPTIHVKGMASVDRRSIDARVSFELDVRELGIFPPRFLMFRVEDVVLVQVALFAVIAER